MEQNLSFKDRSGETLSAILDTPENPNGKGVVLLHCFLCTKHHRIMRSLAQYLSVHGFTVLRFDFSGNGKSGGKIEDSTYTRMMGEVKAAVSLLEKRGIAKIGVAGHSLGAMISLLSAYEDERIRAVAFISGSSQAARVKEIFPPEVLERAEREGSAAAVAYGREIKIKREFLRDIDRYDVRKAASALERPLLVIHGTADDVIDHVHAEQIFAWAGAGRKLVLIEGGDHMFSDEGHLAKLKETACSWFSEAL